MSQSCTRHTQILRSTLCGAGLLVHKSSFQGGYSVFVPASLGGVLLLDSRPYALLPAKIFLPPVPGSESKAASLEHDYASQELDFVPNTVEPRNTDDILTNDTPSDDVLADEGKDRRNCAAIHPDLEVVVSFVDTGLERLSKSVKIVDHNGGDVPKKGETGDRHGYGEARACYVNLDYGWALLDLKDVQTDSDYYPDLEALLINRIWHPECEEDEDANTDGRAITFIKSIPEDGPEERNLDLEEEGEEEGSLPRLCTCTSRRGPQDTTVLDGYMFASFAGTGGTSRHNVLCLEYEYGGMRDHGSWVVDPRTGEWWGMLVMEQYGLSYAVPAEAIVENIKSVLGVREVTLPLPKPRPQPLKEDMVAHYSVQPRAHTPRTVANSSRA
ncbi:hypothetical protein PV04_05417 [Phialophora macrospora]|uniref:Uncharacterized protein n=1 Tax=Phialophora macrospora TaxID=1851006 RepID=A0A0D2FSP7_9EURO|nr:hypothetical protein PV04_05417 [Phialophora macrospora]